MSPPLRQQHPVIIVLPYTYYSLSRNIKLLSGINDIFTNEIEDVCENSAFYHLWSEFTIALRLWQSFKSLEQMIALINLDLY